MGSGHGEGQEGIDARVWDRSSLPPQLAALPEQSVRLPMHDIIIFCLLLTLVKQAVQPVGRSLQRLL